MNTQFLKKIAYHVFTQIEISNVSFSLLSYFRDLFFKSDSDHFNELSFAHLLVIPRRKHSFAIIELYPEENLLPVMRECIKKTKTEISIFGLKSKFQTLVFHFFVL